MNMEALDATMTKLMNLRQTWIDERFPGNLADEMQKELGDLPAGLSEVHQEFFEQLETELDQGVVEAGPQAVIKPQQLPVPDGDAVTYSQEVVESRLSELLRIFNPGLKPAIESMQSAIRESLQAGEAQVSGGEQLILPVRNRCTDIPGHIECFKEHNGLIHGGIIHTSDYTLVCKAYRFFVWRVLDLGERLETDVVAGVCEQKDRTGQIIKRWATAERLQDYYATTSIALPDYSMRIEKPFAGGWAERLSGYCHPDLLAPELFMFVMEHWNDLIVDVPDTHGPAQYEYNPPPGPPAYFNPKFDQFMRPPTYQTAVENALYNQPAYCTEGYPICTQYIKVFSPSPESDITIVAMIGAYREKWVSPGPPPYTVRHERKAEWHVKTFS